MKHRPNILQLATKISLESLTYTGITYNDPEYRILEPLVDDDMCQIMMHMRLETNRTVEEIARRAKKSVEFTAEQCRKLRETGIVRTRTVDGQRCYYYPIWVPGIMEGILSNREQCEQHPELGDCFEEYTRCRVAVLAPFMDTGMNMMRVIPVQSAIENNSRKASYDEVARLVENARVISVGPCSCRRSRRLMGEGCGHLEEDMCLYLNDNAVNYSETGAHRLISKEEAYEILRRAEENGLVHELNVAPGFEDASAICNCCGCSCYALRIASYFQAPDAIRTNYIARVDKAKCAGCGQCVEHCQLNAVKLGQKLCPEPASIPRPVDNARDSLLWTGKQHTPDYRTSRTDVTASGTAPCKAACPAHLPVQGALRLAAQGREDEALALLKKAGPLPSVCAVCPSPCEGACSRVEVDEAVAIGPALRALAQRDLNEETRCVPAMVNPTGRPYGEKIAVIGAGPAGLSCAYFLARQGYSVTVYEKEARPGGLLASPIHQRRLPPALLDAEIQVLRQMGVDFRCGVTVGRDVTLEQLRAEGYKAFFLGTGAGPVASTEGDGADPAFRRQVNRDRKIELEGLPLELDGKGHIRTDAYGRTSQPDVFAGGDAVTGPLFAVNALAAGRRAAESIHRTVHSGQAQELGRDPEDYRAFKRRELRLPPELLRPVPRQQAGENGLTPDQVRAECGRCLGCGTAVVDEYMCVGCGICTTHCEFDAIRLEKIHDADNQAYFHTLGRIVTSLPGKTARVAKKHIGRIGRGDA